MQENENDQKREAAPLQIIEEEKKEPARYDDKPEEEPVPETRIDVEVPKINTDLGKEIHFVKLPNF